MKKPTKKHLPIKNPTYLSLYYGGFDRERAGHYPANGFLFEELFEQNVPDGYEKLTVKEELAYVRLALALLGKVPTWDKVPINTIRFTPEFFKYEDDLPGNCGILVPYDAPRSEQDAEGIVEDLKEYLLDGQNDTPILWMPDLDAARVAMRIDLHQFERTTGMVVLSFNEEQNKIFGEVATACGYALLLSANNPNSGNNIYLYGKQARSPVTNKAKRR